MSKVELNYNCAWCHDDHKEIDCICHRDAKIKRLWELVNKLCEDYHIVNFISENETMDDPRANDLREMKKLVQEIK